MKIHELLCTAAVLLGGLTVPVVAQELPIEGPVPTTALITVKAPEHTVVTPPMLQLEVNGHAAPVGSVTAIADQGAEVAILIDDGLRSNFGVQIKDIRRFITGLPANVRVLVGYMQNGTVRHSGGFSTDHRAVAAAVRIPLSSPGLSASPFFCLQDFAKHWPGQGQAARMVLMITNGVDLYNGSVSPLNQNSPYVESAQNDAQRAGVAVYSIYYSDAGIRGGLANFSGQSYLNQVAEATGGISFYQGRITPPSLQPYLKQFRDAIAESYLVGFQANGTHEKRNTLVRIRIRSTQPGIKVTAPRAVHPGLAERARD